MSSNATNEATDTATEPATHAVKAEAVPVATSPAKKAPSAAVKAQPKAPAKRAASAVTRKAVAAPAKPKAVKTVAPVKAPIKPKAAKVPPAGPQKVKMVRDSFTFPDTEHKRLVEMKKRLIALGTDVKKGELVRAGLDLLAALDNAKLLKAVAGVEKLKTGRPKK